jgi:hypothetical protein
VTPAEADVGVMPFGLGKLTDLLHEGECFPEIAESKRALDAVGVIAPTMGSPWRDPLLIASRKTGQFGDGRRPGPKRLWGSGED